MVNINYHPTPNEIPVYVLEKTVYMDGTCELLLHMNQWQPMYPIYTVSPVPTQ